MSVNENNTQKGKERQNPETMGCSEGLNGASACPVKWSHIAICPQKEHITVVRTRPTGEQCHGRCWGAGESLMDRRHVKGHCAQNKGTSGGLPLPPGNTPTGSCPLRASGASPWLAIFYVRPEPCSLSKVGVQTAGTEETLGSLLLTLRLLVNTGSSSPKPGTHQAA